VTTTADNGNDANPIPGSLRDAINQVNAGGYGEIDFSIPGSGVQTIVLASALPAVTHPVVINGFSQLGSSENTLPLTGPGAGDNAVRLIAIQGGLTIAGGNSTVKGLTMGGIHLTTNGNDLVSGIDGDGVDIAEGVSNNTIGGSTLAAHNVFSGDRGVLIVDSNNNVVEGNYVGVDPHTQQVYPELLSLLSALSVGIADQGYGNVIGSPGAGNVVGGHGTGIEVGGYDASPTGNTQVQGNYVDVNGLGEQLSLPQDAWAGVLQGVDVNGDSTGVTIGGTASGAGNLIGGGAETDGGALLVLYSGDGVIAQGNTVMATNAPAAVDINTNDSILGGTSPGAGNTITCSTGAGVVVYGVGNSIEGNSISSSGGPGIDLNLDGVTLNGSQAGPGPNNWQYFPVLSTATSSGTATAIKGTFTDPNEPSQTVTLEFYATDYGSSNPPHPFTDPSTGITSYYGDGQTYLGSRTLYTDAGGHADFRADFAVGTAGQWISATATDHCHNTSEFCADVQATADASLTFAQNLPAALPNSTNSTNTLTVQASPSTISDVVTALAPANLGSSVTPVSVYLNLAPGTYTPQTVQVPSGMTLYINGVAGTTIDPDSPAFTVASGEVIVSNVTFVTTGDAPTILVSGGSLTLSNCVVQQSTGSSDAAIAVTGGTLDLGTATDPGGNTINVNGTGTFLSNTTATPVTAVGDTFALTVTTSSSLMLVGQSPPPLTGSVNGTPFTGTINYPTGLGGSVTVTVNPLATSGSPVGEYPISARLSGPDDGNSYVVNPATSTTGTMYVVSVGTDPTDPTHVESVTFWDSKGNAKLITATDLSSLDALNLVSQGGTAFDPRSVAQLEAWLSVSPNATAAYQLAVQLAALDLNVMAGYVKATDLVYAGRLLPYATADSIAGLTDGGFIDVAYLMQAANAALAQVSPGAPASDPKQLYELALAQVLQAANGNTDFVSQELLWGLVSLYPTLV
jgi:hypothetical protein